VPAAVAVALAAVAAGHSVDQALPHLARESQAPPDSYSEWCSLGLLRSVQESWIW
jgi:hypothetical protein